MLHPLTNFFEARLDDFLGENKPIYLVRSIWSISSLLKTDYEIMTQLLAKALANRKFVDSLNLKDVQSLLEALHMF
jgi:hypothetical protein